MRKYGIENFSFELIEECTQDELDDKEQYWIKYYDSFKNGYNNTIGGNGRKFFDITDMIQLWDAGADTKQICNELGCSVETAERYLSGAIDNYYLHAHRRSNGIPVNQYSLDGEYIRTFLTIEDAKKSIGLTGHAIIDRVCQGTKKSAGGYQWRYDDGNKENIGAVPGTIKKPIIQYDMNMNFIAEYESATAIEKTLGYGHSLIARCCKNKRKQAYGFIWKYKEI